MSSSKYRQFQNSKPVPLEEIPVTEVFHSETWATINGGPIIKGFLPSKRLLMELRAGFLPNSDLSLEVGDIVEFVHVLVTRCDRTVMVEGKPHHVRGVFASEHTEATEVLRLRLILNEDGILDWEEVQ